MDFSPKPTSSIQTLDSTKAQEIYASIKEFGNADLAYKHQTNSEYDNNLFVDTNKEAVRIRSEIQRYMSGNVVLTEAEYNEDGVATKEATYYTPTTKTDLISQITSDYLDTETVLDDYMTGTWEEFKSSYSNDTE